MDFFSDIWVLWNDWEIDIEVISVYEKIVTVAVNMEVLGNGPSRLFTLSLMSSL